VSALGDSSNITLIFLSVIYTAKIDENYNSTIRHHVWMNRNRCKRVPETRLPIWGRYSSLQLSVLLSSLIGCCLQDVKQFQLFPSHRPIDALMICPRTDHSSCPSMSYMIRDLFSGKFVIIRLRTARSDGVWRGESKRDLTLRQSHQQYSFSCSKLWWSASSSRLVIDRQDSKRVGCEEEFFSGKDCSCRRHYR